MPTERKELISESAKNRLGKTSQNSGSENDGSGHQMATPSMVGLFLIQNKGLKNDNGKTRNRKKRRRRTNNKIV
jgi:hypothetical protein